MNTHEKGRFAPPPPNLALFFYILIAIPSLLYAPLKLCAPVPQALYKGVVLPISKVPTVMENHGKS